MRTILQPLALLIVLAIGAPLVAAEPAANFPLKDGDIWVMAGDSITAQHLHSNYFEAFCFARYPKLKFAFRNSGVGGHTIPTTLARFDYDIAAWKPTVVSVELGMNDQGGTPTDKFLANMKTMVERIRSIKARPVILSASPINNGETTGKLGRSNQQLHQYAVALEDYCSQENIPYADQFHALVDVWGKNKPREVLANNLNTIKQIAQNDSVEGIEHLRAFLAVQEKSPEKAVSMQGDPVHPGPAGQLMMAAVLLRELGADGLVSSATVDASGKLVEAVGCQIDVIRSEKGSLSFDRLDERLPLPIPDEARAVLRFDPTILELSQYTLQVTGLEAGRYQLKLDGIPTATLSAESLQKGVNLTALGPEPDAGGANPVMAQGRAILAAVAAKEVLVSQWRGLSRTVLAGNASEDSKEQLAALTTKVVEADAKIRAAAQPQKLRFELIRVP